MSDQHTKGRLHQCRHSEERLRDEKGEWVADVSSARRPEDEDSANARRLAACWNLLQGIDTDTLEEIGAMYLVHGYRGEYKLSQKLDAARALLAEIYEEGNLDIGDQVSKELDSRINAFLKGGA